MPVFIIAEAGSSHDGDLRNAFDLIREAKDAGADAVKFQTFNAERLAKRRNAPELLPIYKRYEMPLTWLPQLHAECEALEIEFMTTAYDAETLPYINHYLKRFKIASFEALDFKFVKAHFPHKKPIILSAGMMTEDVLDKLVDRIERSGIHLFSSLTLLHCTSSYPCPPNELNLRAIRNLDHVLFGYTDHGGHLGYSDHSGNLLAGALAVAAGAEVIEVHFKLRTTSPDNPDYPHSLMPAQLAQYIQHIRLAEIMMGSGIKTVQPSERPMLKYRVMGNPQ